MRLEALLFIAGLVLLVGGAELLVSGAVQIARRLGVSALVIGLLVGIGTSTPELMTSVRGSLAGAPGIALGNIVGANIANLLLVLGACALARPVMIDSRSLKFDGTVVVTTIVLFALLSTIFPLSRLIGALYIVLLATYLVWSWRIEQTKPKDHTAPFERGEAVAELVPIAVRPQRDVGNLVLALSQVVGGIVMVIVGARWLVDAAIGLAHVFAVSEGVIGLTVVAIGTTLPELATSLAAVRRRHSDVVLGNVFGSCIYNVLGIAGVTALLAPTAVPAEIAVIGNPIMAAVAVLMLLAALTGYRISRREGALMLTLYAVYVGAMWRT